jgi:hypothetical protein
MDSGAFVDFDLRRHARFPAGIARTVEDDFAAMTLPPALPPDLAAKLLADAPRLAGEPFTWTAFWFGRPVAIAGISRRWGAYAEAWMYRGDVPRRAWPSILRASRANIAAAHAAGIRLIEITTLMMREQDSEWARRLGFQARCHRPDYFPDGSDGILWSHYERAA